MPDLIEDVPRLNLQQIRALPNWRELRNAGGANVEMALPCGNATVVDVILEREPRGWVRRRWWLICKGCGSRRRHLYLLRGELRCRRCHGLLYHQQTLPHCRWRDEVGIPVLRLWRATKAASSTINLATGSG